MQCSESYRRWQYIQILGMKEIVDPFGTTSVNGLQPKTIQFFCFYLDLREGESTAWFIKQHDEWSFKGACTIDAFNMKSYMVQESNLIGSIFGIFLLAIFTLILHDQNASFPFLIRRYLVFSMRSRCYDSVENGKK